MRTIRAPRGPTGNLFEDWHRDAIGNLVRRIELHAGSSKAGRETFVSKAELARVLRVNLGKMCPRDDDVGVLVEYTIDLLDGAVKAPRGPRKIMDLPKDQDLTRRIIAFRKNSKDQRAYVSKQELSEAIRAALKKSPPANPHVTSLLKYICDALDNRLPKLSGRIALSPTLLMLDSVAREIYQDRLRELQALYRKPGYAEECRRLQFPVAKPSDIAMQEVHRDFLYKWQNIDVASLRTRLFDKRKKRVRKSPKSSS